MELDWKKIDFLLEAGCSGYEVAAQIGVHHDTVYNRLAEHYGESFSDYSAKKRSKGDSNIKVVQYQKALKGDNHMLIWLGKNRLKQKDKEEDIAKGQSITVNVNGELGAGLKVPAKELSSSDNQGAE